MRLAIVFFTYTSSPRERPKSAILEARFSPTSTLRAARSLWMNCRQCQKSGTRGLRGPEHGASRSSSSFPPTSASVTDQLTRVCAKSLLVLTPSFPRLQPQSSPDNSSLSGTGVMDLLPSPPSPPSPVLLFLFFHLSLHFNRVLLCSLG